MCMQVVWLLQGNVNMPTGDKALEIIKVYYKGFWDETVDRTSIYVTPRNTDVAEDPAGDKTSSVSQLILSCQQQAAERHTPPHGCMCKRHSCIRLM